MRKVSTNKARYFVKSLGKGLRVLQIFSEASRPLTLSEIAEAMGTNNTTATRLCYTLSQLGFIHRDGQKRYQLTPKILTLGYSVISGLDWQHIARHYLEKLFEEVHETVSLSMLDGQEILYVIRIRKRRYLPFDIRIGTKLPVYCTSMGKVLMAMGSQEKTKSILNTLQFRAFTPKTITNLDSFMKELNEVKSQGYAINDEELSVANRSIAAPILDIQGWAIAAICIAVPATDYTKKEMEERFAQPILQVANQISNALLEIEAPLVLGGSS